MPSGLNLPLDFGICTRRNGSGRYPRRCSDAIALSLDCGVGQSAWSTPEVRLPLFSVTRFTARALPLNEQVSNRLLYLLASACQRLWLVHANDACGGSHVLGVSASLTL